LIEGEVKHQHIHAGFAKYPRRSRPRVFSDQLPHLIFAQGAGAGNPCHLQVGGGGADLGIQPAS
jgi:hypothetical protein